MERGQRVLHAGANMCYGMSWGTKGLGHCCPSPGAQPLPWPHSIAPRPRGKALAARGAECCLETKRAPRFQSPSRRSYKCNTGFELCRGGKIRSAGKKYCIFSTQSPHSISALPSNLILSEASEIIPVAKVRHPSSISAGLETSPSPAGDRNQGGPRHPQQPLQQGTLPFSADLVPVVNASIASITGLTSPWSSPTDLSKTSRRQTQMWGRVFGAHLHLRNRSSSHLPQTSTPSLLSLYPGASLKVG